MKYLALIVSSMAVVLTACTIEPIKVETMSNYELCSSLASDRFLDFDKGRALNEITRRNYDCSAIISQINYNNALSQQQQLIENQQKLLEQQRQNQQNKAWNDSWMKNQSNCNSGANRMPGDPSCR